MIYSQKNKVSKHLSSKGFTIVETLVAITILMIAIAGPLVVASKGLNSALYAKDQMAASFLAQETMEIIKNTKDNHVSRGDQWVNLFSQCKDNTKRCSINSDYEGSLLNNCASNGCPIYISSNGYTNLSGGTTQTIFSRYFYLEDKGSTNQLTATVVVSWNQRSIPYEVKLSSVIANTNK